MQIQEIVPTESLPPTKQPPHVNLLSGPLIECPKPFFLNLRHLDQQLPPSPKKKSHPKQLCHRCGEKQATTCCKNCQFNLCPSCDLHIHKSVKFSLHQRHQAIQQKQQHQLEYNSSYNIKISEVKDPDQAIGLKHGLFNINVTQKWNKIISQVEERFEEMMLLLRERRDDVVCRLEKRKEQQLRLIMEYPKQIKNLRKSSEENTTKKSQMSQKLQTPSKSKPQQCQHSDQQGKCMGKYEINTTTLTQLKTTIQKIDFKSTISRSLCQAQQEVKKKMRNSMLLNLGTSPTSTLYTNSQNNTYTLSSGLRSPKNSKLSQSIWMEDKDKQVKEKEKLNQQEGQAMKSMKLNKAKSEKILFKGKNMEISMVSPRGGARTRKLEIMI